MSCGERVWDNGDMIDCGRPTPCSLHPPLFEAFVKGVEKMRGEIVVNHLRRFTLQRDVDETGVSGIGLVAEGVEFTSGMVAMTWLSPHRCVNVYESIKTVEHLHGHGGKTRVVWLDG